MSDLQDNWDDYVNRTVKAGGAVDPNALVQYVLREAYLQNTEDLRFYAEKVKYFNECKKLIRDYLNDLRDFDARAKSGQSNQRVEPPAEVEKLRLDLIHLNNASRHKRMMEKGQSMATDQRAEQVYRALLRRPFKR